MNIDYIKNTTFFENSLLDFTYFVLILIIGLLLKRLFINYISKSIFNYLTKDSDEENFSDFKNDTIKPLNLFFNLSVLFLAFSQINFPSSWQLADKTQFGLKLFIDKGFSLIYIFSILKVILKIISYVGSQLLKKASKTENKMDDQLIPFAVEIIKILAIIFGLFIVLSNVFNVNITALATGLGIGGIAIAMASKESLENLLGSFTIFFDQPFTVGDIVTVGNITGLVEKVGFRSTRIRTFDKSLVSVPNKKMVDAELDNLGKRDVRRVKFYLGLTYDTKIDQIKKIVSEIENLIKNHKLTTENCMVKFQEFGASSLDILIVYFVNSPDWEDLTNVKQEINFEIMNIVKSNDSDFAFPSTTVYLEK